MFSNFSADQLQNLLNSPYVELLGLIASICGIIAFVLACYSFFLPRKSDRDRESYGLDSTSTTSIDGFAREEGEGNQRGERIAIQSGKSDWKKAADNQDFIVRSIIVVVAIFFISAPTLQAWEKTADAMVLIPWAISLLFVIYASRLVASSINRWSFIGVAKYHLSFVIGFFTVAVPASVLLVVLQLVLGFKDVY